MTAPISGHTPGPDPGPPDSLPGGASIGQLIECTDADLDAIGDLIAEAFDPLAPTRWLISDPAARRAIMPKAFRLYAEHAWYDGIIYLTAGRSAAALWVAAGPDGPVPPPWYAERLKAATPGWTDRFAMFDDLLGSHHLIGVPHHHLAILAVRPDRQGQGLGTALLREHHRALDAISMDAYLEASDLRTRNLYRRHGYDDYGSPIRLPGGPQMYPMVRRAKPQRTPPMPPAGQRAGDDPQNQR